MNTGWRTGSDDPAETANTQPRLRKRSPLRWRDHRKALILPGCVLAILGGSLTVRALISDTPAPVSTALEQAAAAPPVRPAEPVSASARLAAQPSRPAQAPDPIPPVATAPTPAPALPSTILAPPDSSTLASTPRPMGLQPDPAVALAQATPAPRVMALAPMRQPAPAAPAPAAALAPAKDKPAREPKPAKVEPAKVEPAAAAEPESASIERDGESYTLVLATVGSRQAADAELRKLIQKHPGVLSGKLTYSRVKDDVWQVRTKGLNEDQAQSLCSKIEAAGGSCTARSSE